MRYTGGTVISLLRWMSAAAILFGSIAWGQNSTARAADSLFVEDGGARRVFEVARDELHVREQGGRGRIVRLAQEESTASIRRRAAAFKASGTEAELVLYEAGQPRNEATRRILSNRVITKLRPGTDPEQYAAATNLRLRGDVPYARGYFLYEVDDAGGALQAADALRRLPGVESAEPELARQHSKRAASNDPYFPQQWHLQNTGQSGGIAGVDANVLVVWGKWRGAGVRIGIVDDGLQLSHPDLASNIDSTNDHDWNDTSAADPGPDLSIDFHGTACAGLAAGRGNNGIGISGAAPDATLVGLRLIAGPVTDSEEADAFLWKNDLIQIKTNSWGPVDTGRLLDGPGTLGRAALASAVQSGRGGRGTIFLWAAGNGAAAGDNSNYDGYANSIYAIAVAAVGNTGKRASYSEQGANIAVSAPSDGGSLNIVTTDLVGESGYNASDIVGDLSNRDYTNGFGGTSAATPLVAGCVALMLQANPQLGWRDAKEILLRSATKIDPSDTDWVTNGAGWHFNHKYGAGLINAGAAVDLATSWTNLEPQTSIVVSHDSLAATIPDNNADGIVHSFDLSSQNLRVEHASVTVNIQHASRGQLAVTLVSPSGTQSRLAEKHSDTGDNYTNWTFSTVRHWGEDAQGVWTLKIADLASASTGKLTAVTLSVYGAPASPVNQPPRITGAQSSPQGRAFAGDFVRVASIVADDPEDDPISFKYQWEESLDAVTFASVSSGESGTLLIPETSSGKLLRCRITPFAGGTPGAPFLTAVLAVTRRPVQIAQHGQSYHYDSDLFLLAHPAVFARPVILNEFSQGASGAKEWVELLVLQASDLRGFKLADRTSTYVTFANSAVWSKVPAGTVIVIYNGGDKDTVLPASEDLDPVDGSIVVAHSNPAAFIAGSWGGLSNSSFESVILRNPSGGIVDALSLNSENVHDPKLGTVGAGKAARYTGASEADVEFTANWSIIAASTATPGMPNGGANTSFVTDLRTGALGDVPKYRFSSMSDVVPGLTIDSDTGVISGVPATPGGMMASVVIERYTRLDAVAESFMLLIGSSLNRYTIPATRSWVLNSSYDLPGDLVVNGKVDTAGAVLSVRGTLELLDTAEFSNSEGILRYRHRKGKLPVGTTFLLSDPANDMADPDHDGMPNLLEFATGDDPSSPPSHAGSGLSVIDGHLHLTTRFPAGVTGIVRSFEVSEDLQNWRGGPTAVDVIYDATAEGFRTMTVKDRHFGRNRFIRMQVSRQ